MQGELVVAAGPDGFIIHHRVDMKQHAAAVSKHLLPRVYVVVSVKRSFCGKPADNDSGDLVDLNETSQTAFCLQKKLARTTIKQLPPLASVEKESEMVAPGAGRAGGVNFRLDDHQRHVPVTGAASKRSTSMYTGVSVSTM